MNAKQIKALAEKYRARLGGSTEVEARPYLMNHVPVDDIDALNHCMWMLAHIDAFADAGKQEKATRWLGFIQGVLWRDGLYTLVELQEHNKPPAIATEFDPQKIVATLHRFLAAEFRVDGSATQSEALALEKLMKYAATKAELVPEILGQETLSAPATFRGLVGALHVVMHAVAEALPAALEEEILPLVTETGERLPEGEKQEVIATYVDLARILAQTAQECDDMARLAPEAYALRDQEKLRDIGYTDEMFQMLADGTLTIGWVATNAPNMVLELVEETV